jgi:hypothetical protein
MVCSIPDHSLHAITVPACRIINVSWCWSYDTNGSYKRLDRTPDEDTTEGANEEQGMSCDCVPRRFCFTNNSMKYGKNTDVH